MQVAVVAGPRRIPLQHGRSLVQGVYGRRRAMTYYKVGDIVYPSYTPVKAGKVIKITPRYTMGSAGRQRVTVKTLKGVIYEEDSLGLSLFKELVEDHERKAAKHRATLTALENMNDH
jgi:hypothetical protein